MSVHKKIFFSKRKLRFTKMGENNKDTRWLKEKKKNVSFFFRGEVEVKSLIKR